MAENVEPLYAVEGKPGPKQHLSHPTRPIIFGRELTISFFKKNGLHKNVWKDKNLHREHADKPLASKPSTASLDINDKKGDKKQIFFLVNDRARMTLLLNLVDVTAVLQFNPKKRGWVVELLHYSGVYTPSKYYLFSIKQRWRSRNSYSGLKTGFLTVT